MKKLSWNRIVAFLMALVCVGVWVLPGVVVSVLAADYGVYSFSTYEKLDHYFSFEQKNRYRTLYSTVTKYTTDAVSHTLPSSYLEVVNNYFDCMAYNSTHKYFIPNSSITSWSGEFPYEIKLAVDANVNVQVSFISYDSLEIPIKTETIKETVSVSSDELYTGCLSFTSKEIFHKDAVYVMWSIKFKADMLTTSSTAYVKSNNFSLWDASMYDSNPGGGSRVEVLSVGTTQNNCCYAPTSDFPGDRNRLRYTEKWLFSGNAYLDRNDSQLFQISDNPAIIPSSHISAPVTLLKSSGIAAKLGGKAQMVDISYLRSLNPLRFYIEFDFDYMVDISGQMRFYIELFELNELGYETGTRYVTTFTPTPDAGSKLSYDCSIEVPDELDSFYVQVLVGRNNLDYAPTITIYDVDMSFCCEFASKESDFPEETEPPTVPGSVDLSGVESQLGDIEGSLGDIDSSLSDMNGKLTFGFLGISDELDSLDGEISSRFDDVDDAIVSMDSSINQGLDDLGDEIGSDLDDLGDSIDQGLLDLGGAIDDGLDDLEAGISSDLNDLDTSINSGLNDLDTSINSGLNDLDTSINQGLDDLEDTISGDGTEGDELEDGSDSLSADTDSVADFEKEQQSVLDDNFEAIQNEVDFLRFSKALLFVQDCLNMAFLSMGDIRIIYGFPLFLGMFFFLCSRVPGAVRPMRNERTRELYREEKVIREHYKAIMKKRGL